MGFGVGDAVGVGVRLLRLPLSPVPLRPTRRTGTRLTSATRCNRSLSLPPSRSLLSTPSGVLAPASVDAVDLSNSPTGSSVSQGV